MKGVLFIAGRPKGSTNKPKPKSPNSKRQQDINSENPAVYKCTRCGKTKSDPKGFFFMSKTSPLFVSNELFACICSDCSNELFENYKVKYKDEKLALMLICCHLDVFFSEELYEQVKDNANFSLGNYLKHINLSQYKAKNFITYLINVNQINGWLKDTTEIRDDKEANWKASDYKNKRYVLESIGYDCFDDESYTDENRKFLYNTLADYLTDDIIEDQHKIQNVILMVKTILQVENTDKLINAEFKKKIIDKDIIKPLTEIKNNLTNTITKIANENGIAAKTSGKSGKGANTLTNIMKEMAENGFEEIKTNIFNIKMCETFKNISDISNKSLFEQLNYQTDDYARMVAKQREELQLLFEEKEKLEESLRLIKIENKELKQQIEGDK